MKKTLTLLFLTIGFATSVFAQITDTFVLNPQDEDATVDTYSPGNNYPNEIEYFSGTWTISSIPTTWRNFFKFNLSCIPPNAEIQSASLSLFYADTNNFYNATDTSLTSSNESVIQRVTSAWYEDSITWNNQPTTTTNDEVILPASTSSTQDYTNMDVTLMVQQMVSNPNANWGFLLRQVTEVQYGRLLFASSDNPHQSKHPMLTVTYTVPTTDCFTLTLDANGEDVTVDNYSPGNNYQNEIEYFSGTWTIGGDPTTWRNFFKFNLPCDMTTATVQSAHLNLYYATINNFSNADHQSLSHSNESVISRVVSPWTEHTINWNNQPAVTTADEVTLAQSTSGNQDYLNIDVTTMVQRMITYPDSNFGFLLRGIDETPYARMLFASGDNPVASKHPTIEVCYSLASGVNEIKDPFPVSIYPNPAQDAAYITADINGNDLVSIVLTDIMGRNVKSEKVNASLLNKFRFEFPSGISSGIYSITLQTMSGMVSKKLIIK